MTLDEKLEALWSAATGAASSDLYSLDLFHDDILYGMAMLRDRIDELGGYHDDI